MKSCEVCRHARTCLANWTNHLESLVLVVLLPKVSFHRQVDPESWQNGVVLNFRTKKNGSGSVATSWFIRQTGDGSSRSEFHVVTTTTATLARIRPEDWSEQIRSRARISRSNRCFCRIRFRFVSSVFFLNFGWKKDRSQSTSCGHNVWFFMSD